MQTCDAEPSATLDEECHKRNSIPHNDTRQTRGVSFWDPNRQERQTCPLYQHTAARVRARMAGREGAGEDPPQTPVPSDPQPLSVPPLSPSLPPGTLPAPLLGASSSALLAVPLQPQLQPLTAGGNNPCDSVESFLHHHANVVTHAHAVTRPGRAPLVPEAAAAATRRSASAPGRLAGAGAGGGGGGGDGFSSIHISLEGGGTSVAVVRGPAAEGAAKIGAGAGAGGARAGAGAGGATGPGAMPPPPPRVDMVGGSRGGGSRGGGRARQILIATS